MKKIKYRRLAAMAASLLCCLIFTVPAYAQSSEPQPETAPSPAKTEAEPETQNPFTPDGTGTVVDNATDEDGKEFYTITTADESVFYLVIDKQKTSENVYFLNTVTTDDLLPLVLAATYTASIDPESIVKKDVYQYGQFVIDTTGKYSEKVSEIENFKQKIMELPNISNIKQVVETDISWAGKNSTGKDQLSIITANDFASIQQFSESGDLDYQQLVQSNQIVAVNGVEGISKGDTVEFTFGDGTQKIYTVGGILDGDLYSNTAIYGGWFLMPTELIAENSVSFNVSIRLIVKANDTGLEHTTIFLEKLVDMSDGLTLTTMQEAIASKEATIRQVGISIIGVTLFLLLFSIITFASTIITNIATKKREYAMFQSIGMTRKQTEKMALCESCVLAIGSLILTLILGIILGQILIKGLISAGIFYLSYTFPLALFTVYCIVVVLIILMITISAFYSLQKTPLVERLRIVD